MAKKPLKVKVIGTGGIGLCLLPTLSRFLNYSTEAFPSVDITLVDGDSFEEKNKNRQGFKELGPKASVTADQYREEYPRINFFDIPAYIDDYNVDQIVDENDIVLLCVDNHKTRKLVSDHASKLKNVTVISGGNDWTDGNVLVHIRKNNKDLTPPLASKFHPEISNPTDEHPNETRQRLGCQANIPSSPQLVITNNAVAATMLNIFYDIVDEKQNEKIMQNPSKYAEAYVDVSKISTVTRTRNPS